MQKLGLPYLITLVGTWSVTCPADNVRSDIVQLSTRDRAEISRIACTDLSLPAAGLIDASKVRNASSLIRVKVRCGSHRAEGTVPVAHLTTCANTRAKWSCEAGYDALIFALPDNAFLTVVPDSMSIASAASFMLEATRLTVPPFHTPVVPLLIPECTLKTGDKAPFKGGALFELTCTSWNVEVTRDCGVLPCRHFVVRADPKPAG